MKRPVPGLPIEQQSADVLLACLGFGEARNQDAVGILAVMTVACNRAYGATADIPTRFAVDPDALKKQILRPLQFSCFNENDPNRDLLLVAWKQDPQSWGRVSAVADILLAGLTDDPTKGASHYFTAQAPVWAKTWPPKWALPEHGWRETARLGDHVFGVAK